MSDKKYPIGGYAPGNYHNRCCTCERSFFGDKRAVQCEPCAMKDKEQFDRLSPEAQAELIAKNIEAARSLFQQSGKAVAQPVGSENIPFDPSIIKQMEGHEQRADESWEDIQKRISQPPAVKGAEVSVNISDQILRESEHEYREALGEFSDMYASGLKDGYVLGADKYAKLCQATTGAVWVKASRIKTDDLIHSFANKKVFYKYNNSEAVGTGMFYTIDQFVPLNDFDYVYREDFDHLEILVESPTAAGDTEEEIFDQYRAIKEKIGKLGYNTFINSKEVEEYREWLRNGRYKHRLEWFEKEYPNGIYSRDEDNGFYGISIMTKKFLAEADAAYENATAAEDGEPRETIENILYATGKFYQEQCTELADVILKEMKGAGDGKEDAVAFMNWSLSSECDTYNCTDEDEWTNIYTKETITTAQLYDIFKNRNKFQ